MKFIIQQNLMAKSQLLLVKEAIKNYPHDFVEIIPFSHEIISNNPLVGQDFIPYGSTLMTTLTKELGWKGLHFDITKFNYQESVNNRNDMLNNQYIMTLIDTINFMCSRPNEEIWFIRPSEDLKQFSGQVISAGECAAWLTDAMNCASSGTYQLSADTQIAVAEPKNILAEWRWFIVGGKIVTGSLYRFSGALRQQRETDLAVINEAQQLADVWLPDECCVMDIALVGTKIKVIEFNCINSSGFYDSDVKAIFENLYQYHS